MAGMNNFAKFFLVFLFCFLLINSEIIEAKEAKKDEKKGAKKDEKKDVKKLCERKSKTWTGMCISSDNCAKECKRKEKAEKGRCRHKGVFKHTCVCYFKCKS